MGLSFCIGPATDKKEAIAVVKNIGTEPHQTLP